ncbi:MAG TPA: aminoacyl--tRNA ligase-related protein [Candidatus Paceibacterota bacterium]|nr:aminoacyl--tRNA ligase-related protein [Candidatus Paceibacterota bacterium]
MRQSQLFTKTRREAPKDEVSKNAQLLIRAGYINKEMAGVYDFLPLGLRTLNKIIGIIRQEMNKIGGQELLLSTLQDSKAWEASGRWSDEAVDVWFKTALKSGGELGLAPTHEEPLTNLMRDHISSYRDLPRYAYQFQTKFRNELRSKSGIMRSREFIMKDLYSFSRSEEEFREFYERCAEAYLTIFKRVGLGDRTYRTFASGGSFSKFSDEFQTVSDAGEDVIYVHKERNIAVNKEVYQDDVLAELGMKKSELVEEKAIEVGNIFPLGTRFSDALGLTYKDEEGKTTPVVMGSYGIGPGRLMGTIVETLADDKGIVWPEEVAPFRVHLVELSNSNEDVKREAEELYRELNQAGIDVLWDDRDARAGEKLNDSDLMGIPLRVVVSEKTLAAGAFECTERNTGKTEHRSTSELLAHLSHA